MKSAGLVVGLAFLLFVVGYLIGEIWAGEGLVGLFVAFIVWLVLTLIAYNSGSDIFLAMSKARKITHDDHPRLFNIVEEMKIASGLPKMPDIYIIDDPAPNAFATGRDPEHAAVAVTSGLLQMLNRDELQGVIAHEMSHIKNRDVLLMIMAGVLMGSIVLLADICMRSMLWGGRSRSRSSERGGQGELIILVVGLVLMILAPIAAQLLYFAISRKREYLADASGALLTRYPEGLASALEKISSSTATLSSANRATAPMYIVNPLKKAGKVASDLTSTHPPVSERIRILRGMTGASFANYEEAFRNVHKGKAGVIPPSALKQAALVDKREATAEDESKDKVKRTRETSDLLWKLNRYTFVTCACGTKFKIPPGFKADFIKCPHCGRKNYIAKR